MGFQEIVVRKDHLHGQYTYVTVAEHGEDHDDSQLSSDQLDNHHHWRPSSTWMRVYMAVVHLIAFTFAALFFMRSSQISSFSDYPTDGRTWCKKLCALPLLILKKEMLKK